MLEDYQNKVCVVTGAASGIGKALCEKLVALGAQVYALDRNKADIEGLSAFVETDLSDKGKCIQMEYTRQQEKSRKDVSI